MLQIDSVNVLSRAHYLPVYSRIGPYRRDALDRLSSQLPMKLFEYWGHEASLLPVELQPLLRWRMAQHHAWSGVAQTAARYPDLVDRVVGILAEHGPLTAQQIESHLEVATQRQRDHWGWNWSVTKHVVEHLFWTGRVTSRGRDSGFRRRYDLSERVLPEAVLQRATPSRSDAIRGLVQTAATALGVFTAADVQDYFRLPASDTRAALAELDEAGDITAVSVPDWPQAWVHRGASVPRTMAAATLLVPFDPLIWDRRRVERLFGMHYRIEIYVPATRRRFGYYVLPFLLGDELVGRVDLKADRGSGVLMVQSAWHEDGVDPAAVAVPLFAELHRLAGWLGLTGLAVKERGNLAAALRAV